MDKLRHLQTLAKETKQTVQIFRHAQICQFPGESRVY